MLRQNLLTAVALTSLLAVTPALAIPQEGAAQTRSTMSLASRNADGTAYEVRVEDGAVRSLKINGEDVPTDRARVTDTGVEVLDEDGEVIHRFAVRTSVMAGAAGAAGAAATRERPANPGGVQVQTFDAQEAPRAPKQPRAPKPPKAPKQAATASAKSMIGAGFGEVDEAVAHHLKVDPSKSTMITSIVDELPAKKAGLEKFDVIVGVDGQEGAGREALRLAIARAEPGTKMKLSVRRGAETKEIEIETTAFDASKLERGAAFPEQGGDDAIDAFADMNLGGFEIDEDRIFVIGPDGKRQEIRVPSVRGLPMPRFDRIDPREIEGMEEAIQEMVERMLRDAGVDENGVIEVRPEAGAAAEKPAPKRGDAGDERLRRMEERMEELRRELERERAARGQKPADA
ncbi:MAG: PDZ domain-containing protein [bacterium]